MNKRTIILISVAVLLGSLLIVGLLKALFFSPNDIISQYIRYRLVNGAKIGSTVEDVYKKLGPPTVVVYTKSEYINISRHYKAPIWPTSPNDKMVLLYTGLLWRMYVFVDSDNRVSSVCLIRL